MTSALHIVCPHCDAINRVPRGRLRDGGKCGTCSLPLYEGRPVGLNSVVRFDKHASTVTFRCSLISGPPGAVPAGQWRQFSNGRQPSSSLRCG
jgi:RNase P subunit RPR2